MPRPLKSSEFFDMKKISVLFAIGFLLAIVSCSSGKKSSASKPDAALENTYWRLAEAGNKPVITPQNAKEVHIKFMAQEKRLQGFLGCNTLGGSYGLSEGNHIQFLPISTKMACKDRMDIENFLTQVLTKANTYKIDGEKLSLYADKILLAKFESVYMQ